MISEVGPSLADGLLLDDKKKDKICDFYLTPRGCMKGDKCDFQHPLSPAGTLTNRVCDFYLTPRGCRKGDQCDFLHPQPKQGVKDKVCTYYMTPQGCIKGLNCDFLHPRPGMFTDLPGATPDSSSPSSAIPADLAALGVGIGAGRGVRSKPCDFFLSPRGCIKGDQCDFSHARPGAGGFPGGGGAGSGWMTTIVSESGYPTPLPLSFSAFLPAKKKPLRAKLCDFFNTARGCVKGDACDFIHQKQKVCDFYLKPQGCRKGALCDFLHPPKEGEAAAAPATPSASPSVSPSAAPASKAEEDKSGGKVKSAKPGSRFAPY
jgi:hypothetical protein